MSVIRNRYGQCELVKYILEFPQESSGESLPRKNRNSVLLKYDNN